MNKIVLISLALASYFTGHSQRFIEGPSLALPDSLLFQDAQWVDVDNDSLLDVMVFGENAAGEYVALLFRNNSADGLEHVGYFNTKLADAASYLVDVDGDNQIDVIVSGKTKQEPLTSLFSNKGSFSFKSSAIVNQSARVIRAADLDGDGSNELILSGEDVTPFLRVLKHGSSGWVTVHDSIQVKAEGIEIFNFDLDNDVDFFVSGVDGRGEPVSRLYHNRGGLYFAGEDFTPGVTGATTRADTNHDGLFDVVISGKDGSGTHHLKTFVNSGRLVVDTDSITSFDRSEIISADFDSDGRTDLHSFGVLSSGDTVNIIFRQSSSDTLVHKNLVAQSFGDYDRDGDLDVIQVRKGNQGMNAIVVLTNETEEINLPPTSPREAVAARIFDRLFLSWGASADDHTPAASLTYDVTIQLTGENLLTGEFDQMTGRRLSVTHGNNTTARYVLLRDSGTGAFHYSIQAVDNAFHAGYAGICKGSGGDGNSCGAMEMVNIDACKEERLTLTTTTPGDWYSFRDGFLAHGKAVEFTVLQADTLFSVEPQDSGCAKIAVYAIQTPAVVKKSSDTTEYVCEGELIKKGVEPHWKEIVWSSSLKGILSVEDSITFLSAAPDTLKVTVSNGAGCEVERNTILLISKPAVILGSDTYQILKGQSVQLDAAGGSNYQWEPSSGIFDPQSSTPIASPLQTTEYSVTVKDSLGCSATGRALVIVEETAFIPTLFTPNSDGNNDVLKIYGLGQAKKFQFTIYNREGSQVFYTEDLSDIVSRGWDGTSGGVNQPAGLYYWNVEGETATGKSLRLNGKSSGSVVLLR